MSLTALELKSQAMAKIIVDGARTYGADQAGSASEYCTAALAAKKVEIAEFTEAMKWLGNHSAVRQWGVKMGFFPASDVSPDALAIQTKKLVDEMNARAEKGRKEFEK